MSRLTENLLCQIYLSSVMQNNALGLLFRQAITSFLEEYILLIKENSGWRGTGKRSSLSLHDLALQSGGPQDLSQ